MTSKRALLAKLTERTNNLLDARQNLVVFDPDSYTLKINDDLTYRPFPIMLKYHQSRAMVKAVVGPYGSGKTVGACVDLIMHAIQMPACKDKIRRARYVIIRNTYSELVTTTIKTWMAWFADLGTARLYAISPYRFTAQFYDKKGMIEIEVFFLAMDSEKDIRKLKSLEATAFLIEEGVEVDESILAHAKRKGRYPRRVEDLNDQPFYSFIGIITNGCSTDHWFYHVFEVDRPAEFAIFHQPPGAFLDKKGEWRDNPHAENLANLPEHHYRDLTLGANEDFINVYVLGKYGMVTNTTPVYSEFRSDRHVGELNYDGTLPIQLGWDFGLTPAAVVLQETETGCINVLAEVLAVNTGLAQFVEDRLLPFLSIHFGDYRLSASVGDPAGNAGDPIKNKPLVSKTKKDGDYIAGHLEELGITTEAAPTNVIFARLECVRKALTTLVGDRPRLMINTNCKTLINGFKGGYCLTANSKKTMDKYDPAPKKNFYSHIQDALQYIMLYIIDKKRNTLYDDEYYIPYNLIE